MGEARIIDCPAQMDIAGVSPLYEFLRSLGDESALVLKADEVERIDTATLQLLVAFVRDAKHRQVSVSWQSPTAIVYEAAGLLGVKNELGLEDQ